MKQRSGVRRGYFARLFTCLAIGLPRGLSLKKKGKRKKISESVEQAANKNAGACGGRKFSEVSMPTRGRKEGKKKKHAFRAAQGGGTRGNENELAKLG